MLLPLNRQTPYHSNTLKGGRGKELKIKAYTYTCIPHSIYILGSVMK